MDSDKDIRRREKQREDVHRREKRPKRARTRSRSPRERKDREPRMKREHSRSRSPRVSTKRQKDVSPSEGEIKKEVPERRARDSDMLNTRTGGAYIPPARLRMMQAQITDKSSAAYQRLAWEALKKSIHGHINKINVGNIGIIIKQLLKENIVRGRGLLSRSIIQAQAASPTFTNVYAALVAAVNSRFPNIGELLLKRLVIQFKRGFKRNDKPMCISSASFIAHLVNQRVAHEILALELLTLLVESPTDDSVEVAIAFLKECGQKLTEVSSKGVNAIFEMLRNILHEGQLDKRVQYMIEVMFQVWKDGFKDHPALIEELELVPEEEQFTHLLMLDDATDAQDILNVFKFDEKYEENEQKYKSLSKEILGSDAESEGEEDGSGSGESGSKEDDDDEDDQEQTENKGGMTIIDNTETNLIALRRTIYLTINSSLDFEECAHKLMKMQLKPGQEIELCHMFLDCCAEQRTYEKFYGLLAQRFCNINRMYIGPFEEIFKDSYGTAHRLDTNRLRNVSKFFAHLLFTDAISWEVMECVKLNEEDTTSSSRIYIKILFQELAEYMGLKKLNDRLKDQTLQGAFSGIFPRDNPKNTRFSINFFTSIGLGGLTDELREHLKQMPKNVPPPITAINVGTSSSDSSSDSSSSSSDSSSDSNDSEDSDSGKKTSKKKKKKQSEKSNKKDRANTSKVMDSTETPKEKNKDERWGHDGFYDTYGKDARRHEPERDHYQFAVPRDRNKHSSQDKYSGNQRDKKSYRDVNRSDMGHEQRNGRSDNDGRRNRQGNDRHEREHQRRVDSDNRDSNRSKERLEERGTREINQDKDNQEKYEKRYNKDSNNDKERHKKISSKESSSREKSRPTKSDKDTFGEKNVNARNKDIERHEEKSSRDRERHEGNFKNKEKYEEKTANVKNREKEKHEERNKDRVNRSKYDDGNRKRDDHEEKDYRRRDDKEERRISDRVTSRSDDRKDKEHDKNNSDEAEDDGWDIRGSNRNSVRTEIYGRYWDHFDVKKRSDLPIDSGKLENKSDNKK